MKNIWNTSILIFIVILLLSCNKSSEPSRISIAKYHDFELANSSDHKVYGYFQFGESKGTVGVLCPGSSATMGFMPFSTAQKAIVTFKNEFTDEATGISGEADVAKYYPEGKFEKVTTVFTFKEDNTIELKFSISEIGSPPGVEKQIVIGDITKKI